MMKTNPAYDAIVVGTSAGGLAVLTFLFEKLPIDFPLPVIVVQHRAGDQKELLEEILQRKCLIPIRQANEKEIANAGNVYIAPPGYHLLVGKDKTFSLTTHDHARFNCPSIDVLFETAAEVYRNKLVGIVLTGANDDGAKGLKAIHENDGFTIAQDPAEAVFPVMPEAAIKMGGAAHIWKLARIRTFMLNEIMR